MTPTCALQKKKCGGCPLLAMPYPDQLAAKQHRVETLLGRFAPVEPIRGMAEPWHYRNKVISSFAAGPGGRLVSGIYAAGSHRVLPVEQCLLQDRQLDETVAAVRAAANACRYPAYDEDRGTGLLRHVLCRRGFASGEVLVVLVTALPELPGAKNFVRALIAEAARRGVTVTTVVQNVNPRATSAVLGTQERVLYGRGYILDTLCGHTFAISPRSFYQVNPVQTEVLYGLAIEAAGLTGREKVIDAYCGIGTIGLTAAPHAAAVTGVERSPEAVRDAIGNAQHNGIRNARFYAADATEWIARAAADGEKADVVFLDPPREGSTPEFLRSMARLSPHRIVYVSCGPESLARDLALLVQLGYRVERICPVDMFPHTLHVETVVQLVLRNPVTHINIHVDVEELVQDKRGQATYPQIKEYVLEHFGLKVSSLYIAQVKQKLGIIERENYNKPKNEDAVQPQCPPDKEKAITDALKHFGMLPD